MRVLVNALVICVLAVVTAGAVLTVVRRPAPTQKEQQQAAIAGLWTLWPDARGDGDRVRFYFFHEKGIGLYRYGKIGFNTTNSFDWRVDGDVLVLKFRKTGEEKRTKFEVVDNTNKARTLMLFQDPKEPLAGIKSYTYVPPSQVAKTAPDLAAADDERALDGGEQKKPVAGRMWIDNKKFATGGAAFSLYQLKGAAIDGRGVGWHHIGDFDDWSTEALTFRSSPSELEMWFTLRGEHAKTAALRNAAGDLTLVEDPRNFWHVRTYKDAGPAFGSLWVR